MRTIKIGREKTNDLVVNDASVSREHARITVDNGVYKLRDLGSTNGTFVNGKKITGEVILQPSDQVKVGNHVIDWISFAMKPEQPVAPKKTPKGRPTGKSNRKPLGMAGLGVLAAAVITGIVLLITNSKVDVYDEYKSASVLIVTRWAYQVTSGSNTIGAYVVTQDEQGQTKVEQFNGQNAMFCTGTGFFVSSDGKIITNQHVAYPWTVMDKSNQDLIALNVKLFLDQMMAQKPTDEKGKQQVQMAMILSKGDIKVTGMPVAIGFAMDNMNLTSFNELTPCYQIAYAGREMEPSVDFPDLALIQTNSKTTPPSVKKVVDLNAAVTDRTKIKEGQDVYLIGFPRGFGFAFTRDGIHVNCQDGKISQKKGEVLFGHNASSLGGASGSPMYDKKGRLVGINNSGAVTNGQETQGYAGAVYATYAVELFNKHIY